jgi:proteasome accessory factor B
MLRIHQELQAGTYPNATFLGQLLEVSTKTISRDVEFMRDRLGLPVDFDYSRNGFHYTQVVTAFPSLQITEGELFALVVAEKAIEQYRGTNFEKPLLSAIKKVAASLPETISINFGDLERSISFRTRAEPIIDLEVFRSLANATAKHQQLELVYKKPGAAAPQARVVDPYHLANINGEWFLYAYDHLRRDIRTFVPARIKAVKPTGKTFARQETFSLEKRLHDSFGVLAGAGQHNVALRFDSFAADFIREKKWHESQQLRELRDGGIELRLTLSSLVEIERWVLSWGGHCRVVKPAELRRMVAASARRILHRESAAAGSSRPPKSGKKIS